MGRQNATRLRFVISRLFAAQHHGASAIAKKHTGRTVFPIQKAGKRFGADNQRGFCLSDLYEIISRRQGKDKPRTNSLDIERRTMGQPKSHLHRCRCRRKGIVGGGRADNNEIDFVSLDTGVFQRPFGRHISQIGRQFTFSGDMPLLNPGAGGDPLIRSVDEIG